jgi:hypothetical protein
VSLSGVDAGNYSVTVPAASLATILQRAITVTADPGSKSEGASDPALTYGVSQGSLVAGDALTGALSRVAGEASGDYAILQGTLDASSNYRLTFVGSTLTITPVLVVDPTPAPTPALADQLASLVGYLASLDGSNLSAELQVSDQREACKSEGSTDGAGCGQDTRQ